MTAERLKEILDKHKKWLIGEEGGERANLEGAYLIGVNLVGANLQGANLQSADMRDANLLSANLKGANLKNVDLRDANLLGANLKGANLQGVMLQDTKNVPFIPMACPDEGDFIGWKKAKYRDIEVIIKLLITGKRSSATGRKCRCDKATVLAIESVDGRIQYEHANSHYDPGFVYRVGDIVKPTTPFYEDRWFECASGIHFFINRQEAVDYSF